MAVLQTALQVHEQHELRERLDALEAQAMTGPAEGGVSVRGRLDHLERLLAAPSANPGGVARLQRHAAQQQIVTEAQRWNVLQCGRRFGKTSLGADLAEEPALSGLPVGWFAPTYKILDEAWRNVRESLLPVLAHTDKQQRRLTLTTGGAIDFWDSRQPGPRPRSEVRARDRR